MEGRHERDVVVRLPLSPKTRDRRLCLEERLHGATAQSDDDPGLDDFKLALEIGFAFLDFSRQREPKIESVNVNDIIEEILSLVETQALFQNIEIIKALNPNLPRIMGDKSQLQQVFINLTLNAAEAMEDGGKLIVNSSVSGGSVKIEFTDSGSGIPPEHIEKIFEPFFTTKSEKDGTGLGLAVSHGIITKHKGTISFDSKINGGTTFTVKLPVSGI